MQHKPDILLVNVPISSLSYPPAATPLPDRRAGKQRRGRRGSGPADVCPGPRPSVRGARRWGVPDLADTANVDIPRRREARQAIVSARSGDAAGRIQ